MIKLKFHLITILIFLSLNAFAHAKTVLVILPDANTLMTKEGAIHSTGYFLSELTVPVFELLDNGYKVEIATPTRIVPTADSISLDQKWFADKKEFDRALNFINDLQMKEPISLKQAISKLNKYVGVFFPGGHATMTSFYKNKDVGTVLNYFHSRKKPTALICHGPTALLAARNQNGLWTYTGYNMTAFSTAEEKIEEDAGVFGGHVEFYLEDELRKLQGNVSVTVPWSSNVVVDRELITGQNPMSDKALAKAFLNLLMSSK